MCKTCNLLQPEGLRQKKQKTKKQTKQNKKTNKQKNKKQTNSRAYYEIRKCPDIL